MSAESPPQVPLGELTALPESSYLGFSRPTSKIRGRRERGKILIDWLIGWFGETEVLTTEESLRFQLMPTPEYVDVLSRRYKPRLTWHWMLNFKKKLNCLISVHRQRGLHDTTKSAKKWKKFEITSAAHRHNVNALLSINIIFISISAVLVVRNVNVNVNVNVNAWLCIAHHSGPPTS